MKVNKKFCNSLFKNQNYSFKIYKMQKSNMLIAIATNLKILRKKFRYTQAELAEKLEISISHVANIERAETSVSLDLVNKIIEVFGITPNDLLLINTKNISYNPPTQQEKIEALFDEKIAVFRQAFYTELKDIIKSKKNYSYDIVHDDDFEKTIINNSLRKYYSGTQFVADDEMDTENEKN